MPVIMQNPKLWSIKGGVGDVNGVHLMPGDTIEVSPEEWEELRLRRSRQFGNRYQTLVSTEDIETPEVERLWIRSDRLLELTKDELAEAARERGLSGSGNKAELADRIVEYETAESSSDDV
jgi:hypothetical protein